MDGATNETNGQHGQQSAKAAKGPLDTVICAMRTGATDARKAAEAATPKIKSAAMAASYWAAYGISFAAVFEWTLVRAGAQDGIKAGRGAVQKWIERVKRVRTAEPQATAPPLIGPAAEESHPVV